MKTLRTLNARHGVNVAENSVKYAVGKMIHKKKFKDQCRGKSGHPKSSTSRDSAEKVEDAVAKDPIKHVRRRIIRQNSVSTRIF